MSLQAASGPPNLPGFGAALADDARLAMGASKEGKLRRDVAVINS